MLSILLGIRSGPGKGRSRQRHRGRTAGSSVEQQMVALSVELMWRALLVCMITPALGQASATATSSSTFFAALTDPTVTVINIPPDNFELLPADWARFNRSNPYVLNRNLTIRSSAPPELGQMDFQFLLRKVLIAPQITLRLERLVLRNVNKLGGFGLDFFMGDKGSVIESSDSVRVKLVCPPPEQSLQEARAFSAPEGFPANDVSIVDGVCVLLNRSNKEQGQQQRQCYDNAIAFNEFTLQVGSADPDAGTAQSGYRLVMHNVTRVCDHYVTAECIQAQSEDTCTADLLTRLLVPADPSDGSWQPQTIAGVVVGGVVGFLVVCCLAGFLLWKHRHWWANGNGAKDSDDDEAGKDSLTGGDTTRQLQQQLLSPGAGGKEADPSKAVKLGVLLGSGSFGRVFKGRWHGIDVAVKIIDPCVPATLPRVLKEAEVMMGLDHPNVVKAYQCSVWSRRQQEQIMKAAAQRKLDARSPRHAEQRSRQLTGRRSSGSASLPSSSTASQAASSSSTAGGLQQPRGPAAAADSIAINIIPDFGPRSRSGAAAAAGAGMTVGTSSSSSGTAAGTLSSGSTTHGAMGHHGSSEGAGSSASAAQRMFTRLWKYQQQDLPEHMLSGPSTARRSQEQSLRTAVTPLSSAAYTLSGSSSMGTVPTGTSAHTAAGVISSTQDQLGGHAAAPAPRSVSSSGTGAGTSGALSSQGMTVSSAGGQDSGSGAAGASGEIQPAPAKPVVGWLRRSSKRAGAESDVLPATDSGSGSSKAGSPAAPAGAGASKSSSSQADPDELQVWLVLELCNGGSLKDAVTCGRIRTNSCQDLARLLSRLLDAANGLAYLHDQGVIHGDLKAANVLLQHSTQGPFGQVAKVSDFGVSAQLLDGATHRSTTSLGTITHMAPEVLRSGRLSKAADVYAYSIMMYEVFTGLTAFAGCHSGAVVERVVLRGERPPVPTNMPPQYALLMQRCWDPDPSKRPTFEQVVACLELLLDNLTSSESEGRISEGVEDERTSSNSDAAAGDEETGGAASQAPAAAAAVAAATKALAQQQVVVPEGATATPSASSSGRGLLRFLSKGSSAGAVEGATSSQGQGLAESVEGSSDWLSGPGTPGFSIRLEQLQGIRQWYMANAAVLQAAEAAGEPTDLEAQLEQPAGQAAAAAAAAAEGQVSVGYRSSRLQPWLDQCVDALSQATSHHPRAGADQRSWPYSRRWLAYGVGKLRSAVVGQGSTASSLSQAPGTPRQGSSIQQV